VGISFSCWFRGTRDTKGQEDCGSGVFIAEDINVRGDRGSGDNTSDIDTHLEAKSSILSSNAKVSQIPEYQLLDKRNFAVNKKCTLQIKLKLVLFRICFPHTFKILDKNQYCTRLQYDMSTVMVDKVALGQVSLPVIRFTFVNNHFTSAAY